MSQQTSVFSLDRDTMDRIEQKFTQKQHIAQARRHELFHVFQEDLSEEEVWALKYLFAYMPVNDLADYDGDLFLSHVRQTLEIRQQVPWGDRVPDSLFLHFVLPYRVNTENIEDSRGILYQELAGRTSSLSMVDAILETNYWCHEKAAYIGSDLRTISPLTMIRNARGRCGEESTLAVAALRSIGIPARQVYTPRWAHCDDNHAWVEAWADGKWYYFGACEPEPRLNQGWFTPPSRRAMLINTRIFADYPGPEEITLQDKWFTEINLLEGYAPTRTLHVVVKDRMGRSISGAEVHFGLYNMAEFYPLAVLSTDGKGEVSFKTGYGDLLIHAVSEGRWGEAKAAATESEPVEIVLERTEQPTGMVNLDMVPPPEGEGTATAESISEECAWRHSERLEEGSKLRASYEQTFIQQEQAAELADAVGLPLERVWDVLRKARGNSKEIYIYLLERSTEYVEWPLIMLESMNEKDLIDTFRPALDDHLIGSLRHRGDLPEEIFIKYVLCPRVLHEMIVPYRSYFQNVFNELESSVYRADPSLLMRRLKKRIEEWEDLPNLKGKGNPVGTYKLMKGDSVSLDIVFVAICRSLGIPARLHPSEQKPQYWMNGQWENAVPTEVTGQIESGAWGKVQLRQDRVEEVGQPASYYENYTLARLEKGIYKTLIYPYGLKEVYEQAFEVEPGAYRMTTGIRLANGTVRARFTYFTVRAGEQTDVTVTFRQESDDIPVLGKMDRSAIRITSGVENTQTLGDITSQSRVLLAWIEAEREPSRHLLRELSELADSFDELEVPVVLIMDDSAGNLTFEPGQERRLPRRTKVVGERESGVLVKYLEGTRAGESGFPHLFVLDSEDQIRYTASGYNIGTGREALRVLGRIEERSEA